MVFLAFSIFAASPVDVMYWTPPMITQMTATMPKTPIIILRILMMVVSRVATLPLALLQPSAARTSSLISSSQDGGAANTGMLLRVRIENNEITIKTIVLSFFIFFIELLCQCYYLFLN